TYSSTSSIRIPYNARSPTANFLSLSPHCSLLFLSPRRPPTPTLFPYTTLFRSHRPLQQLPVHHVQLPGGAGLVQYQQVRRAGQGDRKSTRLNSSHVSISYAVFCLKKKKKIIVIS